MRPGRIDTGGLPSGVTIIDIGAEAAGVSHPENDNGEFELAAFSCVALWLLK